MPGNMSVDGIGRRDFLGISTRGLGGLVLGALPFTSIACSKGRHVTKSPAPASPNNYKISHISEVIHFRKDAKTGSIFLEPDPDIERITRGLESLGFSEQDRVHLTLWARQFNRRFALPQIFIRTDELTSPAPMPMDLDINDKEELAKRGVIESRHSTLASPFVPTFDTFTKDDLPKVTKLTAATQGFDARAHFPVGIDLSDTNPMFIPDSLSLRWFVNDFNPDETPKIETGVYFELEFPSDRRKFGSIVPQGNLPLTIDAGPNVYIIGLDKVGEIKLGRYIPGQ